VRSGEKNPRTGLQHEEEKGNSVGESLRGEGETSRPLKKHYHKKHGSVKKKKKEKKKKQ